MGKKPRRTNLKPPGKCIFCGSGGLTKEHMYPDWLRQFIPRELSDTRTQITLDFLEQRKRSVQSRTGDPHSRRIKCVCAACNNEWMSGLQEATKPFLVPMLQGEQIVLHRKAQTQLAAWVTMTVMVGEFVAPDHTGISADERREFYETRQPLSHWRIWIGRHQRKTFALWSHNAMALAKEEIEGVDPDAMTDSNTQTSTILLGQHLIIHVMSSVIAKSLIRRWRLPNDIAPVMSQVWPVKRIQVTWPPARALNDMEIELMADQMYNRVAAQIRQRRR